MKPYRITWEMVSSNEMWRFCNADPMQYKNVTQIVPNDQIPNEYWHSVTNETDNPWDQYKTLKTWAKEGTEAIRNVKLERMTNTPVWVEVHEGELS